MASKKFKNQPGARIGDGSGLLSASGSSIVATTSTNGIVFGESPWFSSGSVQIHGLAYTSPTVAPAVAPCHAKLKGADRPWVKDLEPQWEKAKSLGLNAEMGRLETVILTKDIRELTKGAGYPEVTDKDLEAMFEFPRLRRKVRWHNLQAKMPWSDREEVTLRLKKDTMSAAGVPIPFGAMLRYEEAKAAGFFTDFKVVYPNVVTDSDLAREQARDRDPAIVGYFAGAMFLICSWDLPKDVAKAEADVDKLLKLKLKD